MTKVKLGISACLLGERVRYDGDHKLNPFLRDTLGQYVDYIPVCPEVECCTAGTGPALFLDAYQIQKEGESQRRFPVASKSTGNAAVARL